MIINYYNQSLSNSLKHSFYFNTEKFSDKHQTMKYPFPHHLTVPAAEIYHIYDDNGKKLTLDNLLQQNPSKLYQALSNRFDRLTQESRSGMPYTDAMEFTHPKNTFQLHQKYHVLALFVIIYH